MISTLRLQTESGIIDTETVRVGKAFLVLPVHRIFICAFWNQVHLTELWEWFGEFGKALPKLPFHYVPSTIRSMVRGNRDSYIIKNSCCSFKNPVLLPSTCCCSQSLLTSIPSYQTLSSGRHELLNVCVAHKLMKPQTTQQMKHKPFLKRYE